MNHLAWIVLLTFFSQSISLPGGRAESLYSSPYKSYDSEESNFLESDIFKILRGVHEPFFIVFKTENNFKELYIDACSIHIYPNLISRISRENYSGSYCERLLTLNKDLDQDIIHKVIGSDNLPTKAFLFTDYFKQMEHDLYERFQFELTIAVFLSLVLSNVFSVLQERSFAAGQTHSFKKYKRLKWISVAGAIGLGIHGFSLFSEESRKKVSGPYLRKYKKSLQQVKRQVLSPSFDDTAFEKLDFQNLIDVRELFIRMQSEIDQLKERK